MILSKYAVYADIGFPCRNKRLHYAKDTCGSSERDTNRY